MQLLEYQEMEKQISENVDKLFEIYQGYTEEEKKPFKDNYNTLHNMMSIAAGDRNTHIFLTEKQKVCFVMIDVFIKMDLLTLKST